MKIKRISTPCPRRRGTLRRCMEPSPSIPTKSLGKEAKCDPSGQSPPAALFGNGILRFTSGHSREGGNPERFNPPGFRVALRLPGMTKTGIETLSVRQERQCAPTENFPGYLPRKSQVSAKAIIGLMIWLVVLISGQTALADGPSRIVSLSPAMTEILYDLGLGSSIVGVTIYCDYPEAAKSKPKVGGFANPSLEAIVAVRPDLVILTSDGNPEDVYQRLERFGIQTYVFRATRLFDLPGAIRQLGQALGVEKTADARAREMEASLARYAKNARAKAGAARPRVLFIIHPEPLLVAGPGTVIDDALTLLGLNNIAADAKSSYPKYSIEEIVRRSPDIIFIGQGPMSPNLSDKLLKRIRSLAAVQKGRVYYVSELLYRLTPRAILGIEELAGYLDTPPSRREK